MDEFDMYGDGLYDDGLYGDVDLDPAAREFWAEAEYSGDDDFEDEEYDEDFEDEE